MCVCVWVGGWVGAVKTAKRSALPCLVWSHLEYICMRQQVLFNNQECLLPSLWSHWVSLSTQTPLQCFHNFETLNSKTIYSCFLSTGLCYCSRASSKSVVLFECVSVCTVNECTFVANALCLCCAVWYIFLIGQSSLGLPRLFGPSEALVKTAIVMNCELLTFPEDEPILLQLFRWVFVQTWSNHYIKMLM